MKLFKFLCLILILNLIGLYLISDRILNQFRKSEGLQRQKIAFSNNKYLMPSSVSEQPTFSGKLSKNFSEADCKNVPKFPKSSTESPLENKLAAPWPESYVKIYRQLFNPKSFSLNALSFSCHYNEKNDEWNKIFQTQLLKRFQDYTVIDKNGLFVEYKFDYRALDYPLKAPWRSAFAQGRVLAGLSYIYSVSPSKELRQLMDAVFQSFLPNNRNYEVSFYDSHNYLWLDEYPLPNTDKPSSYVLNGHIWALLGIYEYWKITDNNKAEKLLREAIETVRDNISLFRFSGRVNCYDLKTCELDYDTQRAHRQIGWLHEITGHPSFLLHYKVFKRDHEIMKRYKNIQNECKKNILSKIKCSWNLKELLTSF
jgi:hypothetical protein